MSDFSQIMVEAVLVLIFGVWTAIMSKLWEDGSKKMRAVILAVTVIAFLAVIVFAGYNEWISFPNKDILKLIWKIGKGLIILILSFVVKLALLLILASLFEDLIFKDNNTFHTISLCISGLILFIVLPFIEYSIFHVDMNLAGMLSVATALTFGLFIFYMFIPIHTLEYVIAGIGTIFSCCLYILMEYEAFTFFATRQFAPPLGVFKWIADAFATLFT